MSLLAHHNRKLSELANSPASSIRIVLILTCVYRRNSSRSSSGPCLRVDADAHMKSMPSMTITSRLKSAEKVVLVETSAHVSVGIETHTAMLTRLQTGQRSFLAAARYPWSLGKRSGCRITAVVLEQLERIRRRWDGRDRGDSTSRYGTSRCSRMLGPGTSSRMGSPSLVTVGMPRRTLGQVGIPVGRKGVRELVFIRLRIVIILLR
mmetsp:Transcript_17904/g.35983  ORF Transcript_17904/g.35983 Transcript_17904/m.35983 type:complete len:207 (+) Transcript_17904:78-698(+)